MDLERASQIYGQDLNKFDVVKTLSGVTVARVMTHDGLCFDGVFKSPEELEALVKKARVQIDYYRENNNV